MGYISNLSFNFKNFAHSFFRKLFPCSSISQYFSRFCPLNLFYFPAYSNVHIFSELFFFFVPYLIIRNIYKFLYLPCHKSLIFIRICILSMRILFPCLRSYLQCPYYRNYFFVPFLLYSVQDYFLYISILHG